MYQKNFYSKGLILGLMLLFAIKPCHSAKREMLYSIPALAAVSAITVDSIGLIKGKHSHLSMLGKARACWMGLAGAAALPIIWYLYKHSKKHPLARKKLPLFSEVKKSGYVSFHIPYYNDSGQLIGYTSSQEWLGKRIVRQYFTPMQNGAECGYCATQSAKYLLKDDITKLFNEKACKKERAKWKKTVEKARGGHRGYSHINSHEIEAIIIKKHVPEIRGKHYEDGMRAVFVKDGVSIIDNIDVLEQIIELGEPGGIDRHTVKNIKNFRNKKEPQVIILNTSSGDVYASYGASWHWIAVKLEHTKQGRIQITAIDSLGGNMQNASILDRLYNLFVNTPLAHIVI